MNRPKRIINHSNWEVYWPRRVTWVGFLIVWGVAFLTVSAAMILLRTGQ